MVEFTVYGDPSPKGSMRAFVPKGWTRPILTSATKGLKAWEGKIAAAAQATASGRLLQGPIVLVIRFYLSRPKSMAKKSAAHIKRPDLDKLIRGATDALIGVVFKDDSQIVQIDATKNYVDREQDAPRAHFIIREEPYGQESRKEESAHEVEEDRREETHAPPPARRSRAAEPSPARHGARSVQRARRLV